MFIQICELSKQNNIQIIHLFRVSHQELYKYMTAINEKRKTDSNLKNTIFLYIEPEEGKHHGRH